MPKNRGILIDRGVRKNPQNIINGGRGENKWGLEFEKRLQMILQGLKEEKQVVKEHKAKIYKAVRYFALRSGIEYYQEREEMY